MSALSPRQASDLAPEFLWRDSAGNKHQPDAMETRHLFHTVSMIWNHVMPDAAKTHDFRRYLSPPSYSAEYMADAIRVMLPELLKRQDTRPEWKARLEFMRSWLTAQNAQEIRILPPSAEERGS